MRILCIICVYIILYVCSQPRSSWTILCIVSEYEGCSSLTIVSGPAIVLLWSSGHPVSINPLTLLQQ